MKYAHLNSKKRISRVRNTLCLAIAWALTISFDANAVVLYGTSYTQRYSESADTYSFYLSSTTRQTISGDRSLYIVSGDSITSSILIDFDQTNLIFDGIVGGVGVNSNYGYINTNGPTGTLTTEGTIYDVTANIYGTATTPVTVSTGSFGAVRLLSNWTSFEASGTVTTTLTNVTLAQTTTSPWTGAEVNIRTAPTTSSLSQANFVQGIGLLLNNVNTTDTGYGLTSQFFGLSIGQNPASTRTDTGYYAAWGTVVKVGSGTFTLTDTDNNSTSVTAAVLVDIQNSDLSTSGRNVRGISNEGSILTVTGDVDVTFRDSPLPGITISGVHIDTAAEIYNNMAASYDSLDSSYFTDGHFLSTTTINGDINVYLANSSQTSDGEYTNVFGVNIGNNTNIGSQSAANNNSVAGHTEVNGDINVTIIGTSSGTLNGAFGGYISQQPQNLTSYDGYDQESMMSTDISGSVNVAVKDVQHSSTNKEGNTANGIYGVYKEGSETLKIGENVVVSAIGASESVLQAVHATAGTITVNGLISVIAESDTALPDQKSNAVEGIFATGGTINAYGGVSVYAEEFTNGALQGIYAYGTTPDTEESTSTTLINTTKVSLTAINVGSSQIQGVYIYGAKFVMDGNITLYLANLQGTGITGTDDQNAGSHIEGLSFNGTSDSSMTGNIEITALGTSDSKFNQNIYGGVIPYEAKDVTFNQSGNVIVTMEGNASVMQPTGTIYGTVSGNVSSDETTRTYTLTDGSRTLNFGSSSGAVFISTTDFSETSYTGSFANFDKVVVNSGSVLYIDGTQSALQGDDEVFGTTDSIETTDGRINGVVSAEGTMTIHSSSDNNNVTPTFEIAQNALSFIKYVENYGDIDNSGVLSSTTLTNNSSGAIANNSTGIMAIENFNMNGGTAQNSNLLAASKLTQTGGTITNASGATSAINTLTVSGGTLRTSGTIIAPNFSLTTNSDTDTSGTVILSGGSFTVPNVVNFDITASLLDGLYSYTYNNQNVSSSGATLSGGLLEVLDEATAEMAISTDTPTINSKIYVTGKLGIGDTTATLTGTANSSSTSIVVGTGVRNSEGDVISGSPLGLGQDVWSDTQDLKNNIIGSTTIPTNSLTITNSVYTGDTGFIQVGGTYSDPVGLDFESGSTLIIPYTLYENSTESDYVVAFTADTTDSNYATITASSNSNIVVGVTWEGDTDEPPAWYVLSKNYDYENTDGENQVAWTSNNVLAVDQYGEQWKYEVGEYDPEDPGDVTDVTTDGDGKVVYLYRVGDEPEVGFCELGYVACHNIKSDDTVQDPTPGAQIVKEITGDTSVPIEQRIYVMNSIANLPFAGGVIGTAISDLNGAITDLNNHLTMDSDTFGAHGVMWPYDKFNNMWLDIHGTWYNQRHLKASGIDRAGWRANAFGFILGYDRKLNDRPVALGAAFSYTGGNVKSTGNISYTKNKYQDYGIHLWGNYSPNEHLNVIGALHWLHNISDVTQSVGIAGYTKAHGRMNTDWLAVGVRFETSLSAGVFTFVPHIEPRYVYAKMRNFDTQIDGTTIWRTHARGNTFFQVPLGIAVRADFLTESGWTIRPNADVTITPQVGSTSLKTELRNVYNAVDAVEGQFMGKFQTAVKVGMQFDRKNWTLGAKYGLIAGDRGRIDHGFILQARLRF